MFLTRKELIDLTGYQRPSFMIGKLKEFGVRFFVAADGYPRVVRSDLEGQQHIQKSEPNIEFLHKTG